MGQTMLNWIVAIVSIGCNHAKGHISSWWRCESYIYIYTSCIVHRSRWIIPSNKPWELLMLLVCTSHDLKLALYILAWLLFCTPYHAVWCCFRSSWFRSHCCFAHSWFARTWFAHSSHQRFGLGIAPSHSVRQECAMYERTEDRPDSHLWGLPSRTMLWSHRLPPRVIPYVFGSSPRPS